MAYAKRHEWPRPGRMNCGSGRKRAQLTSSPYRQMSHEQAMSHDLQPTGLVQSRHAQEPPAMDSVNGRYATSQQGHIAQGIRTGQLTPGETKNLESRESRLNGEIHNDRAANGGDAHAARASSNKLTASRTI